jgi:hypothetical protein
MCRLRTLPRSRCKCTPMGIAVRNSYRCTAMLPVSSARAVEAFVSARNGGRGGSAKAKRSQSWQRLAKSRSREPSVCSALTHRGIHRRFYDLHHAAVVRVSFYLLFEATSTWELPACASVPKRGGRPPCMPLRAHHFAAACRRRRRQDSRWPPPPAACR